MSSPKTARLRRASRTRRHLRVRKNVHGTSSRPRLVITRSARHIYAQVVDDTASHTLAQASSLDADIRAAEGDKKARAAHVGRLVADRATSAGITQVVFDRGGNRYHGRVAALADAARDAGLEF